MKNSTRVLARIQARELTESEKQVVAGGISTKTICTIGASHAKDGDVSLGECWLWGDAGCLAKIEEEISLPRFKVCNWKENERWMRTTECWHASRHGFSLKRKFSRWAAVYRPKQNAVLLAGNLPMVTPASAETTAGTSGGFQKA